MTLRAAGVAWLLVALIGCAAPDASEPSPVPTPLDTAFPKPYLVAGDWQEIEFDLPGSDRWPSLDALVGQVRVYFLAGIRTAGPDLSVTIVKTGIDQHSQTVSLLVTVVGGANSAVAGRQITVRLHQDQRGWWMDLRGTSRVFCLKPLGGFGGTACVD